MYWAACQPQSAEGRTHSAERQGSLLLFRPPTSIHHYLFSSQIGNTALYTLGHQRNIGRSEGLHLNDFGINSTQVENLGGMLMFILFPWWLSPRGEKR